MEAIRFKNQPLDRAYVVTSSIGTRVGPISGKIEGHAGIDLDVLDSNPANVYAVDDGTVIISKYNEGGYGYYTVLNHGGIYCTLYGHMKGNNYRVGDQVKAGDILGVMGSTGSSTGDHLHLELRIGNATDWDSYSSINPTDPAVYLSGGSYPIEDNSTSSNNPSSYNPEEMMNFSGKAVAERVSPRKHPLHAYVAIYLGDDLKLLSTDPAKPNILQNFEYNRLEDAGNTATFTLFDTNWEEIERALINNWNNVYIEYGYPYTNLISKKHKHLLQDYSISITSTGVILTITSMTEGAYQNLSQTTIVLPEDTEEEHTTSNPTEAVKEISRQMGWIVDDKNFDESEDVEGFDFSFANDFPITYINSEILPRTVSADGEIFYFYLDPDNVAYFKKRVYMKDYIRTYVYQKGYDSSVIDLTFTVKGVFGGGFEQGLATGLISNTIDMNTKESKTSRASLESVITGATGEFMHTRSAQSTPLINIVADDSRQASTKLYYYMKKSSTAVYDADMTIVGDPTIELFDDIRIINLTDSGNLHHTSGVYEVFGITDSISGGVMTTSLKLIRNATADMEGIELINPKYLIK